MITKRDLWVSRPKGHQLSPKYRPCTAAEKRYCNTMCNNKKILISIRCRGIPGAVSPVQGSPKSLSLKFRTLEHRCRLVDRVYQSICVTNGHIPPTGLWHCALDIISRCLHVTMIIITMFSSFLRSVSDVNPIFPVGLHFSQSAQTVTCWKC